MSKGLYLDGYRDGSNSHSLDASMFFLGSPPTKIINGMIELIDSGTRPSMNVKLSHKEIKQHGFFEWLGKEAPKLDYYILRQY